ncbi:hypothetical protein EDB85DRAFT_2293351 [Lactarius pseudohatsudake]|nr:hypothetical protein EDB85DRAFT_2293351 [Lactarius pseudohatsudake]
MTDYTGLPPEAHVNRSAFLEHAWSIGRAYRYRALELITICQLISRIAPPKLAHEDAELRRIHRVCDLALRSAAESGMKATDGADERFKEATRVLSGHSERRNRLDLPLTVYSRMEIAKLKDSKQRDQSCLVGPTTTINFVLLRSPLLAPDDPEPVIVSQELSASPSLQEILWNFSRYKDRARITLEQNPHFYLRFPADESAYTPQFQRHPLQDISGTLEQNDTIYVLFDRPGRVFLDTEHERQIFGNVWSLNGSLFFRNRVGALEGEQLVRGSGVQEDLWYRKQPVVYHDSWSHARLNYGCLRPIVTTPSVDPSSEGSFEDWTVLSHPASHSNNIHIYGPRGTLRSTTTLDLPPPPTSERPGYHVLYTAINTLDDDILLGIFNHYRLDYYGWNTQLGWRKISHVCRRWRHLAYSSAFHLGMHISCTYDTPTVDTLDHLPFLPLFVSYPCRTVTMSEQDELAVYHALLLRDRVRHIDLNLPPLILHKFLSLMDQPFPILEDLCLVSRANELTNLALPKTFLAPNLRSVILHRVGLLKGLPLLSSTASLVTLVLTEVQASDYLCRGELVSHLRSLPNLKKLAIDSLVHTPRPGAEWEPLGKQGPPVTLPNLKELIFEGLTACLERLVTQIRSPLLEYLSITLFNQIAFTLPHLVHFTNITEGFKLPAATISFWPDSVRITTNNHNAPWNHYGRFNLEVKCERLNQQIDCMTQLCRAINPTLSGVELLRLESFDPDGLAEWQDDEVDDTMWHELLRLFTRAKELRICRVLSEELSSALQEDDVGSDPGLLPSLQALVSDLFWEDEDAPFYSFIHARRASGRPVHSEFLLKNPPRARVRVRSAPRRV